MVSFDDKTIHFGAAGMSDYTLHKDDRRKANYIARHQTREEQENANQQRRDIIRSLLTRFKGNIRHG